MTFVTDIDRRKWRLDEFVSYKEGELVLAQPKDDNQYPVKFSHSEWHAALNEAHSQIVSAAPGYFTITPLVDEGDDWKPYLNGVLAWRVTGGGIYPITLDPEVDPEAPVLYPDGHVEEHLDGVRHETLADYTAKQRRCQKAIQKGADT